MRRTGCSSVQFILFFFINYNTKLHIVIIHLAGSPGSYFAYLRTFAPKNFPRTDFFKTLTDGRK